MFKKMFGGGRDGAAAAGIAAAPAAVVGSGGDEATPTNNSGGASCPATTTTAHNFDAPPAIPENEELGPVDYAPPPLGVHDDAFGTVVDGSGKHDALEAGSPASGARPSFVWAAEDNAAAGPGGGRSTSWIGNGADLTQRDHSFGSSTAVKRVASVALARRLSRRSSALSADFERRRSSVNFGKLGSDHDGHSSWLVASFHLITAMIGAGILGLPNSFAWLGWIGGCICLVFFLFVTVYCLLHLIQCYHVGGIRHHNYPQMVFHLCGRKHAFVLAFAQRANMIITAIAYTGAAAHSITAISKMSFTMRGLPPSAFAQSTWQHTLIFGAVQLLMSQLPNLEAAWWSSALGAAMSVLYGVIAIALGAMGASNGRGDLTGRPGASPSDKIFGVFNSLGNVAFAFSAAIICVEVEHTLREPPRAAVSMRKSIAAAMSTAFTLYALVSTLCYAALGADAPDDVLLGFEAAGFAPLWLAMLANAAVLLHMVAAVQVYLQPNYEWLEDILLTRFPKAIGRVPPLIFRILFRTPIMVLITVLAIVIPSFGALSGLVGAMTYWPTAVFFPLLCYRKCHEVSRKRAATFTSINVVMGLISLIATVGAMQGVVVSARNSTAALAGR